MVKIINHKLFFIFPIIALIILTSCNSNPFTSLGAGFDDPVYSQLVRSNIQERLDGDFAHAALQADGSLWTWGNNTTGQCGNGSVDSGGNIAQNIKNEIVAFKFREGAAIAADIDGNIWYWGDRMIYLPPPAVDATIETPVIISKLAGTISFELRAKTIDLLRIDGTVWRLDWDPFNPTASIEPYKVDGLNNIKEISGHLALTQGGTVCLLDDEWIGPDGGGYIPGINNVKALQNRWKTHTIILKKDGTVWAWGRNVKGTLGNGSATDSTIPVQVSDLVDISAISANGARCLALKNDGSVWYWGSGVYTPLMITSLSDITLIHAASAVEHLVKKNDGTYWTFTFDELIPYQVPLGPTH